MKIAIISPHTDDAIWSLGSFISQTKNVTIVSPFAGVPTDPVGRVKHETLRTEHHTACELIGANSINGDFFDDVYGTQNKDEVRAWFESIFSTQSFDQVYIPLGIHHPDHMFIRNLFRESFGFSGYYEELPYRVLYPTLLEEEVSALAKTRHTVEHRKEKERAVKAYASQLLGHPGTVLLTQLFVEERLWL